MSSGWSVEFSVSGINGHAWGMSIGEEFATCEARLCLLWHKGGSVYLTLAAKGSEEIFLLDFGQYWQTASYKRWDYEDCCDRLLSQYSPGGPAPTLEDLQDLGIGPLPRLVGGFLSRAPNHPQVADSPGDFSSSSDEEIDTGSSVYSADPLDEEELKILGDGIHGLQMLA